MEITGKLGLRYPPANTVDREAHAARVALLAEDCADLAPEWLDAAAREWARREPFFPRACELRDLAGILRNLAQPAQPLLAAPAEPTRKESPPMTDEEIATMPDWLVKLGIKIGDIDADRALALRRAA